MLFRKKKKNKLLNVGIDLAKKRLFDSTPLKNIREKVVSTAEEVAYINFLTREMEPEINEVKFYSKKLEEEINSVKKSYERIFDVKLDD